MNILYIWDADYPWDIRVEKICNSLKKYKHEVHIVCRNLKKLNEYENISDIHIHRLKIWNNNKINYALSFPAFFNPIWRNLINKVIIDHDIKLIIVRDLPMSIAGILAGEKYNIPVIFDMAENYVAMIQVMWKNRKYRGINLLIRNPYFAKLVERYSIKKFDHIFVVIEEAKELLIKKGINSDTISIIRNTPILIDDINERFHKLEEIDYVKKHFSVIYTGGISKDRGLYVVIDAIPHIIKEIKNFLFVVIGKGYESENILEYIDKKRVNKHVLWLGWMEHDKIYDYIASSKIGVITHHVNDHLNTTIPNKIFDYMMCGIPVISSNAIPMQRILKEEKCGKVFKTGNAIDFAKKVISLYNDFGIYGKNGKDAVKTKYNWDIEEKIIMDVINNKFKKSHL